MTLLRFLLRTSGRMMLVTAVAASLSGACNAGLLAMVNVALNRPGAWSSGLVWSFVGLGFCRLAANFFSQVALTKFSQGTIANLRRDLVRKILAVPLRHLEELGAPRLMAALTEDVLNITQALLVIPGFAVNAAILLGGAAYLGWLSWKLLLGMAGFIIVGGLGYRLLIASGFARLSQAREEEDKLFGHFRALTEGTKELKLHRSRRGAFLAKHLQTATENFQRHNVAAEIRFLLAQSWGHLLFFTLLGLLLFLLPKLQPVTAPALTGYVVTTLYLMGPLAGVLSSLSVFGRAEVSLEKVEKLGLSLAARSSEEWSLTRPEPAARFERLELIGARHSYNHEKDDGSFVLGPINLVFEPGQLVFLVGGNGSGKSTLAKLITGLYPPENGLIRLDGKPITDANRDDYRQLFSAVFEDFYLFESLLGLHGAGLDAQAQDFLVQLHLHHKVRINDGKLSTTALSRGQRKRLALLTAYLEDRPFYVFDEWASDQDPLFKEVFYTQLLPELKARGKTALVITHDDKFFHLADHVIKLDYGKPVCEKPLPSSRLEPVLQA